MSNTITVTLYNHLRDLTIDDYQWMPIAYVDRSKIEFGILFIRKIEVPAGASRLGLHLYYGDCAIEIGGNVSIVETDDSYHQTCVIPGSLTCYHSFVSHDRIVTLLNITQKSTYNKCVSRVYSKADYDAAEIERLKVPRAMDFREIYQWIIGYTLGIPGACAEQILAYEWEDITPIEKAFPGANWTIDGVTPIHDPRFGVIADSGHPPYAITDAELEYNRYSKVCGEHHDILKERDAAILERDAAIKKNAALTERLNNATVALCTLANTIASVSLDDESDYIIDEYPTDVDI